jgi:hypothetical protein
MIDGPAAIPTRNAPQHSSSTHQTVEGTPEMKFMVIVKGDQYCEPGSVGRPLLDDMTRYNHALLKAGILVAAEGLHPSASGARVARSAGKSTVIPGPFPKRGELIAGFWVWEAPSMADAIDWATRCPLVERSDAQIEIRRLFDFGDFGGELGREIEIRGEPLVAA